MRLLALLLSPCLTTLPFGTGPGHGFGQRVVVQDPQDRITEAVRAAADKGIRRLEQGAENYVKNRNCFSCHHNAMAVFVQAVAPQRGFTVEPERVKQQVEFTLGSFRARHESVRKGQGVGGSNTTVAYALATLAAARHPADDTTAALVDFLLLRQREDGAWPGVADRPPSEGSPFTSTALALHSLKAYGEPLASANQERRERIRAAVARGGSWLRKAKPETTEDKVFYLRGLIEAEADQQNIDVARERLVTEQKESGAWSQLPSLAGDPYATGSVLVVLRQAGVPADHPVLQHGLRFLLQTQQPDGSWIVQTRSKPVQLYFDNGDPGGKSQFISMSATGWATLALLESLPPKR